MTVSTETNRATGTGNGATVDFTFSFPYILDSDIQVYIDGALQSDTLYTITRASGVGGTVTFDTAPADTLAVLIFRELGFTQPDKIPTVDKVGRGLIETSLDRLTMITQQINEGLGRAIKFPLASSTTGVEVSALTADRALIVNSAGDGITMSADSYVNQTAAAAASALAAAASETAAETAAGLAADSEDAAALSAAEAATSAGSIALPDATGNGNKYIRQKAAEDGFEYRTVAQTFDDIKQAASETATGVVELATVAEAIAGTDTSRAVTPAALAAASGSGNKTISGLPPYYNNAASISIPSGVSAASSTGAKIAATSGAQTVSLATSGANGLDTGSEASGTWYYLYLIGSSTDSATYPTKGMFSVTNEATSGSVTLPSGYDLKRQLPLAVRNDGSSDIIPFYCPVWGEVIYRAQCTHNDGVRRDGTTQVLSGGSAASPTSIDCSAFIPAISEYGYFNYYGSGSQSISLAPAGSGLVQAGLRADSSGTENNTTWMETSTSQAVEYERYIGSGSAYLDVMGYQVTELAY